MAGTITFIFLYGISFAEREPGERTPQSFYDEFMGYAREYYEEAEHYEKKASQEQGAARKYLLEIASLNRQMGALKEKMANGYLKDNYQDVKRAVKQYYQLDEKKNALIKKIQGF